MNQLIELISEIVQMRKKEREQPLYEYQVVECDCETYLAKRVNALLKEGWQLVEGAKVSMVRRASPCEDTIDYSYAQTLVRRLE